MENGNGKSADRGINIVPVYERRLGFLESEIVQRDVQIEMMAQEIARLTALQGGSDAVQDREGHAGMFDQQTLGSKEEVG